MDESESGGYINTSSEQDGGNSSSELTLMALSICGCTVCVLSCLMIMIINNGNYCKNRGGKKA